ncbi:MAG: PhzF family phenazine biosynthesis protein [Chloroflexi bacterium]|nr:MAG: PhzF family phenazine biosynthesis protein [Chloroflexota bacterium]
MIALMKGVFPLSIQHHPLAYRHVDVFSKKPFSGNGLTVFPQSSGLPVQIMQRITQEMRQFESIFLHVEPSSSLVRASIFTMEEELDFAGHPVLGAACVLHEQMAENRQQAQWRFHLKAGTVAVTTQRQEGWYTATMDQGIPIFGEVASEEMQQQVLNALSLSTEALYRNMPMQMVSTGLPYLLIILKNDLEKAQIIHPDFEGLLAQLGAKFVYVFHLPTMEGRTWDNMGRVEDIATGSAAGPLGAYLVKYGQAQTGTEIILHQGSFVGRSSQITVQATGTSHAITSVQVSGDVAMVAHGVIDAVV